MIFTACTENRSKSIEVFCADILDLNSDEEKIFFLTAIWDSDQIVRQSRKRVSQDSMQKVDRLNLQKIECYIYNFEYPSKDWNYKANLAPWVVLHHSGKLKKKEHFSWLEDAYRSGELKEKYFVTFLDRLHFMEKGERLDIGTSYENKDRIERLIEELHFDE